MQPAHLSPRAALTARGFIAKWGPGGPAHTLTERVGAPAHFTDLCRLKGVAEPGNPTRHTF
ncbi:MAG: hypothetical protein H7242_15985 [Microbacteriaceae bacterium]|nr:hypothetical protein [Burkholderiaceae bacterium]